MSLYAPLNQIQAMANRTGANKIRLGKVLVRRPRREWLAHSRTLRLGLRPLPVNQLPSWRPQPAI
mgnify:CR=1 FL=1